MAGGHRPASYVSGARHNTGVDRSATSTTNVYNQGNSALPPWIPSIWQPSVEKTSSCEQQLTHRSEATDALAVALDSAVQSAVLRALGTECCGATGDAHSSRHMASTESSDVAPGNDITSCVQLSARERDLVDTITTLEVRLQSRDEVVQRLNDRLETVERHLSQSDQLFKSDNLMAAGVNVKLNAMSVSLNERQNQRDSVVIRLQNCLKGNEKAVDELGLAVKQLENNYDHNIKEQSEDRRLEMDSKMAELKRMQESQNDLLENVRRVSCSTAQRMTGMNTARSQELTKLEKEVDGQSESMTNMRLKVKRLESQMGQMTKQAAESAALSSGFEKGMQSAMESFEESSISMRLHLDEMRERMDENNLSKRTDTIDCNVKSLKKLIESNLRTQWNAENIVKEQVSLITKHVCVAMRQYTARRISENNALIDQALRARIPEYAKNNDDEQQFVLVREQFPDGNETVDIQNMCISASEVVSSSSSSSLSSSSNINSASNNNSNKRK